MYLYVSRSVNNTINNYPNYLFVTKQSDFSDSLVSIILHNNSKFLSSLLLFVLFLQWQAVLYFSFLPVSVSFFDRFS